MQQLRSELEKYKKMNVEAIKKELSEKTQILEELLSERDNGKKEQKSAGIRKQTCKSAKISTTPLGFNEAIRLYSANQKKH